MRFNPGCRCCCPCCHALPATLFLTITAGSFGCVAAPRTVTLTYVGKVGNTSTWSYAGTCAGLPENFFFHCVCPADGATPPGYYVDMVLNIAAAPFTCQVAWGPVAQLDEDECSPFFVDMGTGEPAVTGCDPTTFAAEVSE